nr:hypothetical protein [uncultured Acidocella sp.]
MSRWRQAGGNARLRLAYKTLNTMPSPVSTAIRDSARSFLERRESHMCLG